MSFNRLDTAANDTTTQPPATERPPFSKEQAETAVDSIQQFTDGNPYGLNTISAFGRSKASQELESLAHTDNKAMGTKHFLIAPEDVRNLIR